MPDPIITRLFADHHRACQRIDADFAVACVAWIAFCGAVAAAAVMR